MLTSRHSPLKGGVVLFVERSGELWYLASLSDSVTEAKRKRVLRAREKSVAIDPKPGDLAMVRLKWR